MLTFLKPKSLKLQIMTVTFQTKQVEYLDSDGNAATGIVDTKSSFLEGMYGFTGGLSLYRYFLLGY